MVEALLENTCNCFVSSFPAASLQTHGFAFVVLGTNHLVPLAPCLPAWKPQALEMQVAQPFLFPLHLMQPSNPWYWLLGLLAGGATWPEGFALAAAAGLLKPWLWHWLASSARCFHSCGLCLCLGHGFPANSETLETESKFSEQLKSNPVFFFCFRDFGGNWLVGLEKPTGIWCKFSQTGLKATSPFLSMQIGSAHPYFRWADQSH